MAHSQLAFELAAQYDQAKMMVPGADALALLLPRTALFAQNLRFDANMCKNPAVPVFKAAVHAAIQLYERSKSCLRVCPTSNYE